ncbi:hypothetical protein ACUM5Y_01650 [Marinomonas dokdonensis]|uniref:hypothetical protein n=1 Tax=Marinomonas dokdonensis TaxID=328224 RepID=UPI00405552B5
MPNFLVLKILEQKSVSLSSTQVYGEVEIRSQSCDSESEIEVLKKSAESFRSDFSKYSYCARIATVVQDLDIEDAVEAAENLFAEVLDLKSLEFPISDVKTSNIGLTKDLDSGEMLPLLTAGFTPSMSFLVSQGSIQRIDAANYILSLDTELSNRYKRSLHWVRNAKNENNKQLKALFYWFSLEALIKENESDNISGLVRWFLGFPNGARRAQVSSTILTKLASHARYQFWSGELTRILDKMRIFRNDSVHSGFRSVDFTSDELSLFNQVMVFATSRGHFLVQEALLMGIDTVSNFKEYIPLIFEDNNNLINDVHGNIIFSLDRH